jgi:hypothetical protein
MVWVNPLQCESCSPGNSRGAKSSGTNVPYGSVSPDLGIDTLCRCGTTQYGCRETVWADTPFDFAQGRLCPPPLPLTWRNLQSSAELTHERGRSRLHSDFRKLRRRLRLPAGWECRRGWGRRGDIRRISGSVLHSLKPGASCKPGIPGYREDLGESWTGFYA